tara:strand:- start:384 stop:947 length:564 start_codon:yes stop_codon:yes gene_type:complete
MIDDILIFDDIVDKKYQLEIIDKVLGKEFDWYFQKDVSINNNDIQQRPGFSHYFHKKNGEISKHSNLVLPLIDEVCSKINFNRKNILQGRSWLQLPMTVKDNHNVDSPHIDDYKEHLVILYYVLDSDGDTILYHNKYENKVPKFDELKEMKRIKPKQGRVVIFNGLHWHTACQPKKNIRCIINYDVV